MAIKGNREIECPLWQAHNFCSQVVWSVGARVGDALKKCMHKRKAEGEQLKGIFLKKNFILFLEREGEREKGETSIHCLLHTPHWGIPTNRASVRQEPTGNGAGNLSLCTRDAAPWSHTSQGR